MVLVLDGKKVILSSYTDIWFLRNHGKIWELKCENLELFNLSVYFFLLHNVTKTTDDL